MRGQKCSGQHRLRVCNSIVFREISNLLENCDGKYKLIYIHFPSYFNVSLNYCIYFITCVFHILFPTDIASKE